MQRSVPAAFGAARRPRAPIVAGIPARDEADELEGCLLALAGQRDVWPDAVVLCLNETGERDRSRERLYVGMSRATDQLVVVGDPDMVRRVGGDAVARRLGIE